MENASLRLFCHPRESWLCGSEQLALELGLGDKGIEGAVLARVQALAAASNDDDGGARGKPAKKEKLSRAEKKEKKKAYGR